MNNFLQTKVDWARAHKKTAAVASILVLGGGYFLYGAVFSSTSTETRYVLGAVTKGTIISSVSASGQVSASNQLSIQPKVSGEIISINVLPNQKVTAGTVIAVLDSTTAQKNVRDAEVNLESAQLSLEKLKKPTDALSLIQAENALAQAEVTLEKSYDDGFNSVSNAFLALPDVMTGLQDILYGLTVSSSRSQDNISAYADMVSSYDSNVTRFSNDAAAKYKTARTAYDATYLKYRSLTRTASKQDVEDLILETYNTTKVVADAVKSTNDLLGFVEDKLTIQSRTIPAILSTHQNQTSTYTSNTNSHLLTLLAIKNTIISAKYSIAEKTQSLADLKAGTDPLDIKSAELTLTQRKNTLADAKATLADYYVRAPFDGTVASLGVKKYDTASSGTEIATLLTSQRVAELSLNEVDAAKVSVGAKATLTFDAIEDLTLTGQIAEVDTIGAVTSGVVSYSIKIGFDSQDERVKPGMTVNASIQTAVKQDVLMVPSGAVKTQNEVSRAQVFSPALATTGGTQGVTSDTLPVSVEVTVGISDDTNVEILSGLKEGDQVVVRTISGATAAKTTTTTSRTNTQGGPSVGGALRGF
ncbi:MAG: efflux RND transporter periplasmic adaptor subunit [Candidatus Pacebacteria bacterium]|jgi:HlyD family secretion protein|nr:efflux RND transporter periplasmic adaptor subunit [Candidatus Paceibacterota bacterium]